MYGLKLSRDQENLAAVTNVSLQAAWRDGLQGRMWRVSSSAPRYIHEGAL